MMSPEQDSPAASCDLKRIQEFLNSDQYHIDDADLTAHLDVCPSCRAYLEAQAGEPERWRQASLLLKTHEYDQASNAVYSAATFCSEQANQPVVIKDVLDILVPSEHLNHLGRLGTYEVTGVVGVGGMGVVLKAIDLSLDRVVALKVMSPKLAHNENARKRFAREAKAAAAVLHPNVIPIHSVSSGSPLPYLVMSYIRGGSLQKRLDQGGPLPLVEVLRIGSQIAAGLAAAHEQGLIHRDIKPENILLEEGVERVTITDFGLARSVDDNSITQLGSIAGTPQYMSPEQASGAQLDQQSDLFSLGSLLYTLCTGRPPFRDDTSYGVMRKIIDEEPEPIRKYSPDTPLWMVELVEKLMAKEKVHRFKSAKEVHTLLDACISHVQHPSSNPIPSQLLLNQTSTARKKLMKLFAGIGIVMVAALLGIVQLRFNYLNQKTLEDNYVFKPLSEVDSYIETMMKSDYEPIFLNLGLIGDDENGCTIQPTTGGVTFRYSAYDINDYFNKRQAKYVPQLVKAAESMQLHFSEKSDLESSGSVRGIRYEFRILGDPETVAMKVKQLLTKSLEIHDSVVCGYNFVNMPGHYYQPKGQEEREVSKDAFLRALENEKLVYMGEHELNIFLIPHERLLERPVTVDSEVLYTDVRNLSSEELQRIRSSK
jgi:serine/threonine protein kinase